MRINNPRLFNGDMLATYSKIESWLGIASGSIQNAVSGYLPSSLLAPLPGLVSGNYIYADNILLSSTLTGTIADKFAEQQAAIDAVKQYNVVPSGGIFVNKTSIENASGITVDTFTLSGVVKDSATSSLLKVDPSGFYVDEANLSGRFKLVSQQQDPTSQWASVYELQYLGLSSFFDDATATDQTISAWLPVEGDKINIAKDQFLSAAIYDKDTESLQFTFAINQKAEDGSISTSASIVDIPVSGLVHEYEAGNGIDVNYEHLSGSTYISIKTAPSGTNDNKFINLTADGLGLSGITAAITGAVDQAPYAQIVNLTEEFTATSASITTGYFAQSGVETRKKTLFVDKDGQTALYIPAEGETPSSILDISQEYIAEASGVTAANSEKLMSVKAVSGYVAERETAITESYKEADEALSGILTSYISEQTAATVSTVNEKAVEMLEVTGNIGYDSVTSGNAVAIVPGRVIAVYDASEEQVYPTIKYVKDNATSTLSIADGIPCATYTIIYAKRIGQTSGQLPVYGEEA